MKLLGKIYKEFVKIMIFAISLILFPLIISIWIICEVMSRVKEKQLEKVENREKEYGQKKRN